MNTSDLKDSARQNSPVSKSQPKIPTVPQAILRLKKKSPSFKITLFKPKSKEKANHAHSSSVDFMEIFREVACYQPTALDSPTNPKKINKMQPKASLPSSTGDSYSKILSSWRQKDDSPVVEPFLAVHNVFGKNQDSNLFSDTLTSFFVGAPDIKEIDNHNQSSNVPFYLEEKKTLAKSQTKSPVPNLKNFVAKSSQDLLIPLKQKSDKTDDTKTNLKPYKIYTNYRRSNNYTVKEYDQCVSKELIDIINSKEKSGIISSREIPSSPVRSVRRDNNNKESLRSTSVPRASIPGKAQSVSKITVNAEWRSGLTKAKPKQEKNIGSISESPKEEQVYKHPVLKHLQTRRNWVKKRGHNNSAKKLLDNKNTYSWGQIVDRNTILRKYPLVLNIGKEKEEEDLQLFILKRRSVEGGKF